MTRDTNKEQLNKAEMALWRIFNIVNHARKSEVIKEIRDIVSGYLNDKISDKEEKRGSDEKV